ncbi:hypothetical protein CMI45_00950 [Candidatus Pacearchaeota archaeon]|nr:hypothetical protein [Candidatus Pacearchaeota archaeon]|tara:strand:+ start:1206 stop:1586 length:381 start_codon:yes stop_codon:yes gene_type:complete
MSEDFPEVSISELKEIFYELIKDYNETVRKLEVYEDTPSREEALAMSLQQRRIVVENVSQTWRLRLELHDRSSRVLGFYEVMRTLDLEEEIDRREGNLEALDVVRKYHSKFESDIVKVCKPNVDFD